MYTVTLSLVKNGVRAKIRLAFSYKSLIIKIFICTLDVWGLDRSFPKRLLEGVSQDSKLGIAIVKFVLLLPQNA
jgi:hypothetical protein